MGDFIQVVGENPHPARAGKSGYVIWGELRHVA